MKKFSLLHPLALAFYSKPLYVDVARNWKGMAIWYLLFLLATCWVFEAIAAYTAVSRTITEEAPALVEQVPHITIRNGNLSIDRPVPYVITDPETDEPIIVFDTSSTVESLGESEARVLVTSNTVHLRKSQWETRTFDLSKIEEFDLTKEDVNFYAQLFRRFFVFLYYPFAVLISFAYRFAQVLIYGALGLAICRFMDVTLNYLALVRLAVIAITPAVIIDMLLNLGGFEIPLWSLLCLAMSIGYLTFGISAVRVESQTATPESRPNQQSR